MILLWLHINESSSKICPRHQYYHNLNHWKCKWKWHYANQEEYMRPISTIYLAFQVFSGSLGFFRGFSVFKGFLGFLVEKIRLLGAVLSSKYKKHRVYRFFLKKVLVFHLSRHFCSNIWPAGNLRWTAKKD